MKKFFLFLILAFSSHEVFAQQYSNQGIWKDFVAQDSKDFLNTAQPLLANRFVGDVGFNDNYQSTNRQNEYDETFAAARLFSKINLPKGFAINSFLHLERLDNLDQTQRRSSSARGGGDRAFENLGVYFEELNLSLNREKYSLIAGKFDLDFGTAWRYDRGLWIHNVAENYKQTEKLGFGGIYRAGNAKKTGQYNFGLAVFTNDRKNLDNSWLVNRDSDQKSAAIPGDSRSLKSYNASLDINFDFGEKEKLTYHFSYIDLAVNASATAVEKTKIDNQKGYVLGGNYKYPLSENVLLDGLLEYANIKNLGGNSDVGENYFTANLITHFYQNWSVLLGNSRLRNYNISQIGYRQNLSEISLGYEFNKTSFFDKLTLQVGYKNQRLDYVTSLNVQNVYGILLRYYKNF